MSLTMTTVTGHWVGPDDQPSTGQVVIRPVASVTGTGTVISGEMAIARLVDGAISVDLVSNTEASALQYLVTEQIDGAKPISYVIDPVAPSLDLGSAPRSSVGNVSTFILTSTVGQPDGVASLDSSGKVPTAQLPVGSGGSGVSSVVAADSTIVVAGTSTAPTVRVGSITQSQVTNLASDLAGKSSTSHTHIETDVIGLTTDLAGKANVVHTHSTSQIPDFTSAVDARIDLLVAGAPGALNTLDELAAALGDDPNFAGSITTAISNRALAARQMISGAGLLGGGDLTADRTLSVQFGSTPGTVAEGSDTRISGAIQASTVDAKGDLLVGTADNTVARLAAGSDGKTLVTDSSQTSGFRYAKRQLGDFPFSGDGLIAASAPLTAFRDNSNLNAPGWAVRMFVPAGEPITTCWSSVTLLGTLGAGGVNGFAIYDDAGNLISSTVDDNALWSTLGVRSKALPAPIAAQSSDRFVYVAIRVSGYSVAPGLPFCQGQGNGQLLDGLFGSGRRRGLVLSGSSWASTVDTANGTAPSGYTPFLAIS